YTVGEYGSLPNVVQYPNVLWNDYFVDNSYVDTPHVYNIGFCIRAAWCEGLLPRVEWGGAHTGVYPLSNGGGTATLVAGPAHGTLNLYSDGRFDYAPNTGFSGLDSFIYTAHAAGDDGEPTPVTILVTPAVGISVSPTSDLITTEAGGTAQFSVA